MSCILFIFGAIAVVTQNCFGSNESFLGNGNSVEFYKLFQLLSNGVCLSNASLFKYKYLPKVEIIRVKRSDMNNSTVDLAYRRASQEEINVKNTLNGTGDYHFVEHSILIELFKESWPVQTWYRYGLFTDDYLDILNEHWLQFPPPSKDVHYALGGFYILFVTAGVLGNILVLFMYIR